MIVVRLEIHAIFNINHSDLILLNNNNAIAIHDTNARIHEHNILYFKEIVFLF